MYSVRGLLIWLTMIVFASIAPAMAQAPNKPNILVINPGSTSTKISLYSNAEEIFSETISHKIEDLSRFNRASDQDLYRMEIIVRVLREKNMDVSGIQAVVGRGGLLRPIEGGTYTVNDEMIADLKKGVMGDHPSNCGGLIAYTISKSLGCESFIVDPVVVDELHPVARFSGMPLISRKSIFHALNQKSVAREVAQKLEKPYNQLNIIVAHMNCFIHREWQKYWLPNTRENH